MRIKEDEEMKGKAGSGGPVWEPATQPPGGGAASGALQLCRWVTVTEE